MRRLPLILIIAYIAIVFAALNADARYIEPIRKAALKHKVSPELFYAIVVLESGLDPAAYNIRTRDYGLGQVNHKTAVRYGFDTERLKVDVHYNLDAAAKILSDFQRRYARIEPKTWPCRYNVGTRSYNQVAGLCSEYLKRLNIVKTKLAKEF
jgi:soluble lytic murein transglycosylase-like protein